MFVLQEGCRLAGKFIANGNSKLLYDQGAFVEIDLVNKVSPKIKKWCENGCPGITGITKMLLQH